MKPIKLTLLATITILTALWLAAEDLSGVQYAVFALRTPMIYFTGILAIGVMSVALILAARPVVFEAWLGGLDKMYRLHKWLGITALIAAIAHWLWIEAPKWLVKMGWIVRPARGPRGEEPLAILRDAAEGVGEWAFYAVVALVLLALVKRFPYRHFFRTHRLLAVAYPLLVFHSVVLFKVAYWSQAVGVALGALMSAATVAVLMILFGRVGRSRQAVGVVERVLYNPTMRVLEVDCLLQSRWRGHQSGQFVFVSFGDGEGPHPFTVASDWRGDGRLGFVIKELGDYTRTLPGRLKAGDLLRIEGPYGRFNFDSGTSRQIWVGGGIGITPFLARMKHLASHPDGRRVDLFHTTGTLDAGVRSRLQLDADKAGVKLHVLVDDVDGRLGATRICEEVPDWRDGDIWFCGPKAFGDQLRKDFRARGLAGGSFHQELFELR
ncbi:MAG TPA: ferric reductase-like transmembrane domain-containing protein [Burkholderiaceae bacterium]|jgi:predicted ferric reductase|nr:ferric reductase-like transmembrane domain-containing protein [Burkholderiaceae bacterium]